MPVILLPYKYKIHFEYIDNKHKLCSKYLSIDNLEKEGYYILPFFNETSKKRKRKDGSCKKSTRNTKVQIIIHELFIRPVNEVSIVYLLKILT